MSLPLVILLMAILAVAVTAGFARVSEERRIVGDQQAQVDAFAVAQSGLERYVALRDSLPGAYDSVAIPIGARDTAHVVLFQIRAPAGPTPGLYAIRSRGVSNGAPRYSVNTPPAQRTVAQYAIWQDAAMDVDAAWTTISGLAKVGVPGTISGNDACGVAAAIPGVAAPEWVGPDSGYRQTGGPSMPTGSPGVQWMGTDSALTAAAVAIDWGGIVSGTSLTPDYSLTGTPGWPGSFANWPVILVNGTVTLDGSRSGQGILIVTGEVTLDAGFTWLGVILSGDATHVEADANVRGAVVSGLNIKLSMPAGPSSAGNVNPSVRYDSCALTQAMTRFAHLQLTANAWTDSWPEN